MILLANAVFIIPFLLFSGLAGQLADKYEKATIVILVKASEIAIVILAINGFRNENLFLMYLAVGLMGVHSTFCWAIKI
jgi:acyl-[acyl-carrier-protein]-phospholipid O-acyltransferase/long-chain-fatty-acid--[acyl-carrier-protein] ligase